MDGLPAHISAQLLNTVAWSCTLGPAAGADHLEDVTQNFCCGPVTLRSLSPQVMAELLAPGDQHTGQGCAQLSVLRPSLLLQQEAEMPRTLTPFL
jgi:hypothetical protein